MSTNLKLWNKLIDSAEGLEVNLKVGKECELNVKGNFMAMAKLVGIVLEQESVESRDRLKGDLISFTNELDENLRQI